MIWILGWIAPLWIVEKDEFILFFKLSLCKIASAARSWPICAPQAAATTFVFSSVFILRLCQASTWPAACSTVATWCPRTSTPPSPTSRPSAPSSSWTGVPPASRYYIYYLLPVFVLLYCTLSNIYMFVYMPSPLKANPSTLPPSPPITSPRAYVCTIKFPSTELWAPSENSLRDYLLPCWKMPIVQCRLYYNKKA